jgi:hypothetical protein
VRIRGARSGQYTGKKPYVLTAPGHDTSANSDRQWFKKRTTRLILARWICQRADDCVRGLATIDEVPEANP